MPGPQLPAVLPLVVAACGAVAQRAPGLGHRSVNVVDEMQFRSFDVKSRPEPTRVTGILRQPALSCHLRRRPMANPVNFVGIEEKRLVRFRQSLVLSNMAYIHATIREYKL